ncbi:unnamed protein product [Rotaria magnacalcarata]|uniref:Uncharacterized protein n=3 Tax=Rotaria magnacalcarata TaxID=392030 RepID=A0A819DHP5_9BILA|nr:unnamed protein product [Rotaria magnacalcarata]CAF3789641.1 unnamed protein product [Rotaria magnacalcarata]CAF3835735.1 unnamed protein product [Rotaria magnacalcarata]CAF3888057.1 unnamed protein product [Rotaria magnacalcarata]
MSNSSKSPMNTKISSTSSMMAPNHKEVSITSEQTKKTATSNNQMEDQIKTIMVDRQSSEECVPKIAPIRFDPPKFVSAAVVAATSRSSVSRMPEISDEELLEMTIKFEMDHPEYASNVATPESSTCTIKRTISDGTETEANRLLCHHQPSNEQSQYSATYLTQIKSVGVATIIAPTNMNTNVTLEITDEELLQMALMFEKQQEK